jgi:oligo-1,6-glucosidase
VLTYFKKAVQLRKTNPSLVYGKYTLLDKGNPKVYAYTRELDGKKFLILLNFKSVPASASTGIDLGAARTGMRHLARHLCTVYPLQFTASAQPRKTKITSLIPRT